MKDKVREELLKKYPATFVEHVEKSEEEALSDAYNYVFVNVSKMAKLLGNRRNLDTPIQKLLDKKRDINWYRNQRSLRIDKAYEVWKWRRLKQGKDVEEVENDARLIFIKKSDIVEIVYPYSEDSETVRFVGYHGLAYMSVLDVTKIYNPIFELFADNLDCCFMRYTDENENTETIMMMDAGTLLKMFWDDGIFKPRFERWVKHEVHKCLGLGEVNSPFGYQRGEEFIENYMEQRDYDCVYPLHIVTPHFMRWVDIDGSRWVSVNDFMTRIGINWATFNRYKNDFYLKTVQVRRDDLQVEKLLVYEVEELGELIDSMDNDAKSTVANAYEMMFKVHPFFTGE